MHCFDWSILKQTPVTVYTLHSLFKFKRSDNLTFEGNETQRIISSAACNCLPYSCTHFGGTYTNNSPFIIVETGSVHFSRARVIFS